LICSKGSVGVFFAERARQLAFTLEQMGREENLSGVAEEFAIFEKEINKLKKELITLISTPVEEEEEEKEAGENIMDNFDERKKRVLVAEDVKVISKAIMRTIKKHDFDVDIAEDGEQCLEKVRSFCPDLVILDLMMPKIDGVQVLKEIKTNPDTEDIGVIVCTAQNYKTEQETVKELGAFDIVSKPIKMEELISKVKQFFSTNEVDVEQIQSSQTESEKSKIFEPTIETSGGYFRIWGTRGSTPVSGPRYVRHGGNTSCLEVNCGDEIIIFDAGSGIRDLGERLMKEGPRKLYLFIGHTHWDHIQGFPFFTPAYIPGFDITIYGAKKLNKDLEAIFRGQLDSDYFPVQLEDMNANLVFKHLDENPIQIGKYKIYWEYAIHPGPTVGYKIDVNGQIIAWLTDNEILKGYLGSPDNITLESEIVAPSLPIIKFMSDVDISISEAQYMNNEYVNKVGWGHASLSNACLLAQLANIKKWIVTHYDPQHDDNFLEEKFNLTQQILKRINHPIEVIHGYDGFTYYL